MTLTHDPASDAFPEQDPGQQPSLFDDLTHVKPAEPSPANGAEDTQLASHDALATSAAPSIDRQLGKNALKRDAAEPLAATSSSMAEATPFWTKGKKIGASVVAGGAVLVGIGIAASSNKVADAKKGVSVVTNQTPNNGATKTQPSAGSSLSPTSIQSTGESIALPSHSVESMAKMTADEFATLPLTDRMAYLAAKGGPALTQFNDATPEDDVLTIFATEQQALLACYGNQNPVEGVKCLSGAFYYVGNPSNSTAPYNAAKNVIEQSPGIFYGGGFSNGQASTATEGHDEYGTPVTYRDVTYTYSTPGQADAVYTSRYFLVDVPLPDHTVGHRWLTAYTTLGKTAPSSWNR